MAETNPAVNQEGHFGFGAGNQQQQQQQNFNFANGGDSMDM
jgi:importin subunit alpha-1